MNSNRGHSSRLLISVAMLCVTGATERSFAFAQERAAAPRTQYNIELDVDIQQATINGRATIRYFNASAKKIHKLVFLLYPNFGLPANETSPMMIQQVRSISSELDFEVRKERLGVDLEEPLEAGQTVDIHIDYVATAPRIEEADTVLTAHLTQQVAVALGRSRSPYRGTSAFFALGTTLLLARPYPVIGVFHNGEWRLPPSFSPVDPLFAESADYQVSIWSDEPVNVYATGREDEPLVEGNRYLTRVRAHNVRDFSAVLTGRGRVEKKHAGKVPVEALCDVEEESCRRVEEIASKALALFSDRFGAPPFDHLKVLVVPLPPAQTAIAVSGMVIVGSAYTKRVRVPAEQTVFLSAAELSPLVEGTLETSLVSAVAAQWWGLGAGFDPGRHLFFAEALRSHAVSLYFALQGEEREYERQLQTSYRVYRTFGGLDHAADRGSRQYANSFELSSIASVKGAMFFDRVAAATGKDILRQTLRSIAEGRREDFVTPKELLDALCRSTEDRESQSRLYHRWIEQRHGDEDIARPEFVISISQGASSPKSGGNAFRRLGRFFLTQMTRLKK